MTEKRWGSLLAGCLGLAWAAVLLCAVNRGDLSPARAAAPLHVKPGGTGDCSTWTNACSLPAALTAATSGDEIWVAAGTHTPTTDTNRAATFQLKTDVAVYGGFGGITETLRSQRDPAAHVTLLSGDLGMTGVLTDNSYHVVKGATGATLDGFVVTGGYADGSDPDNSGGGMFNDNYSSPTLANVTFISNTATYGGGLYNRFRSSPTLTNVTFISNTASTGGGLYNRFSSNPLLTNVAFISNTASAGGGIYNWNSCSPTLTHVSFISNTATYGGGIANYSYSSPALTDVTFTGNSAGGSGGGGMYNEYYSSPQLTNVAFSGNSAAGPGGGGMYNASSSPTLTHVIFISNTATYGGGMHNDTSSPTLTHVTFSGNSAAYDGGGLDNSNGNPTLTHVTFSGNSATNGGGMANHTSSPTLMNVTFSSNTTTYGSGGGLFNDTSSPTLTNVTFSGNSAASIGGGMYNSSSSPRLTNVTFSANSAAEGGGLFNYTSSPTLQNVLIAHSLAGGDCLGSLNADSHHNLIQDAANACELTDGADGNLIGYDPYLGAPGNYGGGTLTLPLLPGSRALDAGDATACPATDQRDVARPQGAGCDIGAFESRGFSLTYSSGSPQSALINTAFAVPLALTVTSAFTEPVHGGQVLFTAPGSGASTHPPVYTATLSGVAASQAVTANHTVGAYTVTATTRGNWGSAISYLLTNTSSTLAAPLVTAPLSGTTINDPTPTFTGTAEAGNTLTVTLQPSGPVLCVTTAEGSGNWSCTATSALSAGRQTVAVVAGNGAGNQSAPTLVTFTVDTLAPAAPTVTAPVSGTLTADPTPTFTGTGEPDGTAKVYDNGSNLLCTATVAPNGSWSCTPPTNLPEGPTTCAVTITDLAGNQSAPTLVTFTVDTLAPAAPTVTTPVSGTLTADPTPTFTGTGEPDGTAKVYDDGSNLLCTATVAPNGSWSCTPTTNLPEGPTTCAVTITDPAGNQSAPTLVTFTVDTLAPAAPTVTAPVSGTLTADPTPTFTGTGEPGGTAKVYDDGSNLLCTATVAPNGSWSCTPATNLPEGPTTCAVTITDPAGNQSAPTLVTFTIAMYHLGVPVVLRNYRP